MKPTNVCIDASLSRVSVIDFGLSLQSDTDDFFAGFTHGYYTPETFVSDSQGRPTYYCSSEQRQRATNTTTDVFLTSFMGLEVAVGLEGLPWELRGYAYDLSKHEQQLALMKAHDDAAKAGFKELIARVSCPVARDFFEKTMCADPAQRLTPAQALNHKWLVSCRHAVQQAVEAALPALQDQNQQLIEMFSAQLPEVLVPKCHLLQQQEDEEEEAAADSVCTVSSVDAPATPSLMERNISCSSSSAVSSHSSSDNAEQQDSLCDVASEGPTATAGVDKAAAAAAKVQRMKSLTGKFCKLVSKGIKVTWQQVKKQAKVAASCCTPSCLSPQTVDSAALDHHIQRENSWLEVTE